MEELIGAGESFENALPAEQAQAALPACAIRTHLNGVLYQHEPMPCVDPATGRVEWYCRVCLEPVD